MDELQTEFDLHYPSLQIQIIGMNEVGVEIGNPSITAGRDIPWLQDVDNDGDGESDVWRNSWAYEYRDVVIVDDDGGFQEAYNLTRNDLSKPENFATLKSKFIDVAATPPITRWQSPIERLDVDGNSVIAPKDALFIINDLGQYPPDGRLPIVGPVHAFLDVDGDGMVSPRDAIRVINQLDVIAAAMSQSAAQSAAPLAAPLSAPLPTVSAQLTRSSSAVLPSDIATDNYLSLGGEVNRDDLIRDEVTSADANNESSPGVATSDFVLGLSGHGSVLGRAGDPIMSRSAARTTIRSSAAQNADGTTGAEADLIDVLFANDSWVVF